MMKQKLSSILIKIIKIFFELDSKHTWVSTGRNYKNLLLILFSSQHKFNVEHATLIWNQYNIPQRID